MPLPAKFVTRIRSVEAAAIAGVAGAILTLLSLVMLNQTPSPVVGDAELTAWYDDAGNRTSVLVALTLAAFSSIVFLWFVAVMRRRIGEREDQFFATVFLGSAIVYVAVWLVAAAAITAPAVAVTLLDTSAVDVVRNDSRLRPRRRTAARCASTPPSRVRAGIDHHRPSHRCASTMGHRLRLRRGSRAPPHPDRRTLDRGRVPRVGSSSSSASCSSSALPPTTEATGTAHAVVSECSQPSKRTTLPERGPPSGIVRRQRSSTRAARCSCASTPTARADEQSRTGPPMNRPPRRPHATTTARSGPARKTVGDSRAKSNRRRPIEQHDAQDGRDRPIVPRFDRLNVWLVGPRR